MKDMYRWHCQHYPAMEPEDVVKLYFQAMLGCGHLLGDEETVAQRIAHEEATLAPAADEPLTEPLGPHYVRLNLRRAMEAGLPPLWIARLMKCSEALPYTRADVVQTITQLDEPALMPAAQRLLEDPRCLPSHSAAYHAAYAPAYRVISRQCAQVLPVLQAIAAAMKVKKRLLLCIDGPCGSGKTTVAGLLCHVLDAAVIPMDDFFLPHEKKTAERLAQPGGNADWERLLDECVSPWLRHEPVKYRPYDCHADAYGQPITVADKAVTIFEGSYSLLPVLAQHADVRVFVQVSPEEQERRIRARNGDALLQVFRQRWIPLEQAYFAAYQLPDEGCVVLSSAGQDT